MADTGAHPAAAPSLGSGPPFAEAAAWHTVGEGWCPLFGSFRDLGFSFEWHDFQTEAALDWGRSFHPGGLELCLNLEGEGTIEDGQRSVALRPRTAALYFQGATPLVAGRAAGVRHRFVTVEFSTRYLKEHVCTDCQHLHPVVQEALRDPAPGSRVAPVEPLGVSLLQLVETLRGCPVFLPARECWFRSKALELVSHFFFQPGEGELFCTRTRRAGRERVERAKSVLAERLQEPPPLEELGRLVGCSPFYLSRLFSQETGMTLQQYLRQLRLERAAELLRTGQCNVTEAALEVGYNSLSHFSTAFRELFQCCPGLYPVRLSAPTAARSPGTSRTSPGPVS